MTDFIVSSSYFGITLSFIAYMIFHLLRVKLKIKNPFFNPLLLSSTLIIVILLVTKIDYSVYNESAGHVTFWLTPVTICLAIPLYRNVDALKNNVAAIIISIFAGCVGHVLVLTCIALAVKLDPVLLHSVMPKSVTTAIALALCDKLGGLQPVTIVGITIAGLTGTVLGPSILKFCRVKDPVAQGLAIGTASHALGTSKAMELGEVQAAMSSVAIVITGIMTVIVVPIVANLIK